jgi:hypothetical protein
MQIILILEMLKISHLTFLYKKILKENEDSFTLFWNIHFFGMEYSKLIETSAEAVPALQ